jgi:uncharacterized membrane protein YeaQ/YmgE (transglycosylase-associated protein family)
MGIIAWIVLGVFAGSIARAILPGDDLIGVVASMLIGILGALVGGFVGRAARLRRARELLRAALRRSKPLPVRLLHTAAAGAGTARVALRRRTPRPQPLRRNGGNRLTRALRRS